MRKYTKQDLDEMSDTDLIKSLILDRKQSTTNPYSILNQRLNALYTKLDSGKLTIIEEGKE